MTKHALPANTFCEQTRYLQKDQIIPRSMKICSFISRIQELNNFFEEFPHDAPGQETESLPMDKVMNIIYHSMPARWKNKMIK